MGGKRFTGGRPGDVDEHAGAIVRLPRRRGDERRGCEDETTGRVAAAHVDVDVDVGAGAGAGGFVVVAVV